MSLWTPDGEIPIDRSGPPRGGAADMVGGPSLDDLSPEERAQAEAFVREMAAVQEEIARTPIAQLVANHIGGFYELAAIKLSQVPPQLAEGKVAIDAMAAVLDAVGSRLGPDGATLRDALTQLQMAFVQLSETPGSAAV